MQIPTTLKIGGHTVPVVLVDEVTDNLDGLWDSRKNAIQLRKDLPPTQMQATLIHEIIHCLCMQLRHEDVEWLAQGIFQVLSDNNLVFDGKGEK